MKNLFLLLVVNNIAFEEGNKLQNLFSVLIGATCTVMSEIKLLLFDCF